MESIDKRKIALELWLTHYCQLHEASMEAMPGDASFRRYFRVKVPEGSFVAMDAPPEKENCQPFVAIAHALRSMGVNTPEIIQSDLDQGFLLLTDFGDATYLRSLNPQNADQLYKQALQVLSILQTCRDVPGRTIPRFNRDLMWQEWSWHKEWFLVELLGIDFSDQEKMLDHCYSYVMEVAIKQPQVFMHRDYHSANLMVLANQEVGILDFQDAFIGPVTYDLVSLLRDCYIGWPQDLVKQWTLHYLDSLQASGMLPGVKQKEFLRWFDLMGVQRHLKALLTFSRKKIRDNQPQYIKYIPRTLDYLLHESEQYEELLPLHTFLKQTVAPAVNRELEKEYQCAR